LSEFSPREEQTQMSNQPQPPDDNREKKRAQFSGTPGRKSRTTPILAVALIALLAVAAYVVLSAGGDQPESTSVAPSVNSSTASNPDLRIPIADLSSGKAKFFDYKTADNKAVRFFVLKSSDGVYRAALDACDTCFHAKKGYHQEGDEMICNNCNLRFHSSLINEVKGGCNPVGLPRAVENDQVVIKASELDKRSSYF
jgi:uncharacterized membrane protein